MGLQLLCHTLGEGLLTNSIGAHRGEPAPEIGFENF